MIKINVTSIYNYPYFKDKKTMDANLIQDKIIPTKLGW